MGDDVTNLLRKVAAAPRLVPPAMRGTHRFEFGRRLGSGTFGEVFVARDREHGGAVALKALRSPDDEWVYRFKREFRHVADVSHANIVRLYELFEESGSWFLTMELVDGIPFDEHLARLPEQLESSFSQLASGIRALHSAGVLHRDIKPSNALVEATGRVVLLDFGLAYGLSSSDQQILAGTPLFMAPEQWTGDLGESTDWYAFGAMLYSELSGASPFEGRGGGLLASKLKGPKPFTPPPGRESLADLALRLLHPNPAERPGYREIAAAFPVTATPEARAADRLPFVGRTSELARMRDATSSRGAVWIQVMGEPGIGKTALARAFLEEAKLEGASVYGGRCHETESTPFKGLDGAVDMLASDLAGRDGEQVARLVPPDVEDLTEMFPVLKRVARLGAKRGGDRRWFPHARRLAAFGALRDLFSAIAVDRRVFLFIDDIQWAGEDTLLLLSALLDPPPPGLVVLTTMRSDARFPESVSEIVRDMANLKRLDLELSPFDREEVGALVAERQGGMDRETVFRESGGHPYLLSRILASGGAAGALTADLRESISALSEGARWLLEVISLEAQPLSQSAAFAAAGIDGFRADVVDELRRQRLARTSLVGPDALIEPYHDRVRETLLALLSPDELRRGHESLARYLESKRRASPHSLAHHYQEAGNVDNARRWIRLAAGDAVRGLAFLRADELYRQAVHLSSGVDRVDLLLEWAEAMVQSGRRAHAASIFFDASKAAEAEGYVDEAAELRTRAGEHWVLGGDFKQGMALLETSLRSAGVDFPSGNAMAMNLALQTAAELMQRGLDFRERPEHEIPSDQLRNLDLLLTTTRALLLTDLRATFLANLALSEALQLGEPRRVQRALAYFVFASAGAAPELPFFVDAVARAYALAERQDDDAGRTWAIAADAIRFMQAGDFRKAWPLLREAERRFWSLDPPMSREAGGMRILILACASVEGVDVPFARRVVDNWISDAASRDDYFVTNWMRLVGSRVMLIAGDTASAIKHSTAARATWSELDDDLFASTIIHVEMGLRLYAEPDRAHEFGNELSSKLSSMFVSAAPIAKVGFQLFYSSALAAGGSAGTIASDELVGRLNAIIAELSTHNYDAPAIDAIRSYLALHRGDRQAAAEHMLRSAEGWAERAQRLHSVCARLRYAELVRDSDETAARTRELLDLGVGEPERYATLLSGPAPPP